MSLIEDGKGSGRKAGVNGNNRLLTSVVNETEEQFSGELGKAWNINTGDLTLTGSAEHAVLYMKNNEAEDFVVSAIAVGIGPATSNSIPKITISRNPTAGTIVSDATTSANWMVGNRNFGSSETITADIYGAAASGKTLTDGDNLAQFYQATGGRLFANIDFILPKGASMGLEINPDLTSGASVVCYAAIIGYLKDANEL